MDDWRIWCVAVVCILAGCSSPMGPMGRPMPRTMAMPSQGSVVLGPPTPIGGPVAFAPQQQVTVLGETVPTAPAQAVVALPNANAAARWHQVLQGETLPSVAQKYGLTAEQVRVANGLDDTAQLMPNQKLFIPNTTLR